MTCRTRRRSIGGSGDIQSFAITTRAREERADARQDYIDELAERLIAGDIPSDAARVAIDAEKWQMAKEKPKVYDNKVENTIKLDESAQALWVAVTTGKIPEGAAE